ncbi:MAG: protein-tyrosine-phosphatase [Cyclobacteriaceae bacterium]
MKLNPDLEKYITLLKPELDLIDTGRKELLLSVTEYVRTSSHPRLNFICTHNSRRSHLGQIWAQTAAAYFDEEVVTFSGGTEATVFHPNAIAALKRAGFEIEASDETNPRYSVRFSRQADPLVCFSKKYDDEPNPKSDFAAIMTCSEADQECPIIPGVSERIKLLYEDPKIADGTSEEASKYDERCRQIATEMLYVFSKLKEA